MQAVTHTRRIGAAIALALLGTGATALAQIPKIPKTLGTQAAQSRTASAEPQARYAIRDLGVMPGGLDDVGLGLAANGAVVGWQESTEGAVQPMLWRQSGPLLTLGALPGFPNGYATDISGKGQIVGVASDPGDLRFRRAFAWQSGQMRDLGALGGKFSMARSVNNRGQIVGGAALANGETRAFLWENGKMRDLGVLGTGNYSLAQFIGPDGRVVGISNVTPDGPNHAFLWENGKMRDLGLFPEGGTLSHARAINAQGQVVGWADTGEAETHSFLWENGKIRDLGTLGDEPSAAWSVNNRGQVVGTSSTGRKRMHAYLWENGQMRDLNSLIAPDSGWTLVSAYRINDAGQIVGKGRKAEQIHAFLLTPTAPLSTVPAKYVAAEQTFRDVNGKSHTLAEFRGKPTLLYWFCGCDRCRRVALAWGKETTTEPKTIVFFLGSANGVRALAEAAHFDPKRTTLVAEPPTELLLAYKGQPCPRAVVLDAEGKTRYTNTNADDDPLKPTTEVIVSRVRKALSSLP